MHNFPKNSVDVSLGIHAGSDGSHLTSGLRAFKLSTETEGLLRNFKNLQPSICHLMIRKK